MASPKAHCGVSLGLLAGWYCLGFFVGLAMGWLDFFWILVFGVLIDADHLPFGRLWKAYRSGCLFMVWKKFGWFDENHLDFLHTWWALAGATIFSLIIGAWVPIIAFGVHMLVDGGSRDQLVYPKCAPLPRALHRFYPEWLKYNTPGVPPRS